MSKIILLRMFWHLLPTLQLPYRALIGWLIRDGRDPQIPALRQQVLVLQRQLGKRPQLTRGEKLGLSEDELAFYDALETNDSAVKVLGDDTLRTIAREHFADKGMHAASACPKADFRQRLDRSETF